MINDSQILSCLLLKFIRFNEVYLPGLSEHFAIFQRNCCLNFEREVRNVNEGDCAVNAGHLVHKVYVVK